MLTELWNIVKNMDIDSVSNKSSEVTNQISDGEISI